MTKEIIATQASQALVLPDISQPAINPSEPTRSYKIDFGDRTQWYVSTDNGTTKHATGTSAVAGAVCDLQLQISVAKERSGHDYRLRLAFYEQDGDLSELNINAINTTADGILYVTSPARSLCGALYSVSEAEDDMAAMCQGTRFTVKPGRGRGVFIGVDIAYGDQWIAMSSASNTNRIARNPDDLIAQLALIKSRFRGGGHLLTSLAVTGETTDHNVVDTSAT